jgi:hypothetical protein
LFCFSVLQSCSNWRNIVVSVLVDQSRSKSQETNSYICRQLTEIGQKLLRNGAGTIGHSHAKTMKLDLYLNKY